MEDLSAHCSNTNIEMRITTVFFSFYFDGATQTGDGHPGSQGLISLMGDP